MRVFLPALALLLTIVISGMPLPSAIFANSADVNLDVPVIGQRFSPPEKIGGLSDSGINNCVPASVAMVLQQLQNTGKFSHGSVDYTSVRRAFRKYTQNTGFIDPYLVERLVPLLTGNQVQASAYPLPEGADWQQFLREHLSAGYPVIVIVNDMSMLAGRWKSRSAHSIVVSGLKEGKVIYNDPYSDRSPWEGKQYSMPADEFAAAWRYTSAPGIARWGVITLGASSSQPPSATPVPRSSPTAQPTRSIPTPKATPAPASQPTARPSDSYNLVGTWEPVGRIPKGFPANFPSKMQLLKGGALVYSREGVTEMKGDYQLLEDNMLLGDNMLMLELGFEKNIFTYFLSGNSLTLTAYNMSATYRRSNVVPTAVRSPMPSSQNNANNPTATARMFLQALVSGNTNQALAHMSIASQSTYSSKLAQLASALAPCTQSVTEISRLEGDDLSAVFTPACADRRKLISALYPNMEGVTGGTIGRVRLAVQSVNDQWKVTGIWLVNMTD